MFGVLLLKFQSFAIENLDATTALETNKDAILLEQHELWRILGILINQPLPSHIVNTFAPVLFQNLQKISNSIFLKSDREVVGKNYFGSPLDVIIGHFRLCGQLLGLSFETIVDLPPSGLHIHLRLSKKNYKSLIWLAGIITNLPQFQGSGSTF